MAVAIAPKIGGEAFATVGTLDGAGLEAGEIGKVTLSVARGYIG